MKILATADLHNDSDLAARLAEQAEQEDVELVLLCGDLGHGGAFPRNIVGPFVKKGKKVLIIGGNHDSFADVDSLAAQYEVRHLHDDATVYDHVGFFGCGGSNIGFEGLEEEEIFGILTRNHAKVNGCAKKVLVAHNHPSGTVMDDICLFLPGSRGLQQAIEQLQPDIVFCGHAHEGAGMEEQMGKTTVMNVSRIGKVIDV